MELRHLRYFVAVASDEHMSKAARRIHVSVSPLSRQIRQLEDEVGVKLFQRVGRGVRLTQAGSVFLQQALEILASVERAVGLAHEAARGQRGELRVGFVDTATHVDVLSEMIRRFRASNGGVAVKLSPMSTEELWARLLARQLDAALACDIPSSPELRWEQVFSEPLRLIIPRDHPLAARDIVFARDLENEPFVWTSCSDHGRPDPLREALAARGVTPQISIQSPSASAGLSMAANGLGLAFGLEAAALPLQRRVVVKPIADIHVTVRGVLVWHAAMEDVSLVRKLRESR